MVSLHGTHWLSSAYFICCVCFAFFYFFLFTYFFVDFTTCLGIKVNLSILIVVPRFLSGVSSGELIRLFLVWLGSVWVKIELYPNSTCLFELLAAGYLREFNKRKNCVSFINGYLFFRCLEKSLRRGKKWEKKGKGRGVTTNYIQYAYAFLIMSNFYFAEILSEPNSLAIVTSKKILKMRNNVLTLGIFFS